MVEGEDLRLLGAAARARHLQRGLFIVSMAARASGAMVSIAVTCSAASSRLPCRMIVFAPPVGRMRTATVTADRAGSPVAGVAGVAAAASRPGVERGGRRPGESGRRPGVGESGRRPGARIVGVRTAGITGAAVTVARAFRGVDRRTPGDAAAAGRAARAVAGRLAERAAAGDGGALLRLEDGRSPGIGLAVRRWKRPSIV